MDLGVCLRPAAPVRSMPSTGPFSLPEQGLRYLDSTRWCPLNGEDGPDSVTSPRTIPPASVALSRTGAPGARPRREKTAASPARRHSDL